MSEIVKICDKEGITKTEMLASPKLLRLPITHVEGCYLGLKEGGFNHIKPPYLTRYVFYFIS